MSTTANDLSERYMRLCLIWLVFMNLLGVLSLFVEKASVVYWILYFLVGLGGNLVQGILYFQSQLPRKGRTLQIIIWISFNLFWIWIIF